MARFLMASDSRSPRDADFCRRRQTNPISRRQAQGRAVPPSPLRPFPSSCTNKPNFRQAIPGPQAGGLVQTKPIPGRARRIEAGGAWGEGQMRKTNPILRRAGRAEARGMGEEACCTNKPNSALPAGRARATAVLYKQTQFPAGRPKAGRFLPSPLRPFPSSCTNKPNFRQAIPGPQAGGLHKQSQSSPLGRGRWVGNPPPQAGRTHWRGSTVWV
jgi:hypothetical protein